MADELSLRIDTGDGPFDDHARRAIDELLGAGLDRTLDAADEAPHPTAAGPGGELPGSTPTPSGANRDRDVGHDRDVRDDMADDVDDGDLNGDPDDDSTGRLIRPYAMTGGRTGAEGPEIPLEAQVLASSQAAAKRGGYRWEAARLLDLVETPMALVEIAARLEVPVGVTRVLVADLVADGSVIVHLPPPSSSFTSLLEQVLDGIRDL